jgi:methylated-DNA-[protein]-cysteine S-methyltransferase
MPYELDGTAFQKRVWKALAKIHFGETKNYKQQAMLVKSPKAVRAVGRTNGLNPLSIVLPCHRVIGSNGSLTGYGGGLKIKKYLLDLESSTLHG